MVCTRMVKMLFFFPPLFFFYVSEWIERKGVKPKPGVKTET